MQLASTQSVKHWEEPRNGQFRDRRNPELTSKGVRTNHWWNCIKQQQSLMPVDTMPPLGNPDGRVAIASEEKAKVMKAYFNNKLRQREFRLL